MHRTPRLRSALPALLLAAALCLAGCTPAGGPDAGETRALAPAPAGFPVVVRDDAGRDVTVTAEPARIVSLAPADTEIVAALGLEDRLVGVTTFDDYPASVTKLPKVGDFAGPNIEAVAATDPDIVLATSGVQADAVARLEDLGATVVVVDPQSLEALYSSIAMVGKALGAPTEAEDLVASMRDDMDAIAATVLSAGKGARSSAFIEIAQDPLFTAGKGTLIDDLMRVAGADNVVRQSGYVAYSLEQLMKDDPEWYFATKGSMSDPEALGKRAGYGRLGAVRAGRVTVLEDDLISRPGPRVVEGALAIAQAMHATSSSVTWPKVGE